MTAEFILTALGLYAGFGALFAVAFLTWGAGRMDEVAAHMPMKVRIAVFPGCVALWPWLAMKWASGWKA